MRKSLDGLSGLVAEYFDVQYPVGTLVSVLQSQARLRQDSYVGQRRSGAVSLDLTQSTLEIDRATLSLLLSGIDLNSAKRRKRFKVV